MRVSDEALALARIDGAEKIQQLMDERDNLRVLLTRTKKVMENLATWATPVIVRHEVTGHPVPTPELDADWGDLVAEYRALLPELEKVR